MKKRIVILDHNRGRLGNILWNSASILAYCCERGYDFEDYSFPSPYQKFFKFSISNHFLNFLFFGSFKDTLISKKLRIYHRYAQFMKFIYKQSVLESGNSLGYFSYLPPSTTCGQLQKEKIEKIESSKAHTIYFTGGLFRNPAGMLKYHREIEKYFSPMESIKKRVADFLGPLRAKYPHIVGVHIRQGDYRTFYSGKYYFSPDEVRVILDNYLKNIFFTSTETLFIICSDENIDIGIFNDLQVVKGLGGIVEDLFTLSMTDIVIGSQSTYGMFAAYYGNIPIAFFKQGGVDWDKIKTDEGYQFPSENLSGEKVVCKICEGVVDLFIQEVFDDRYGYPKYFDILLCKNCRMFQTNPPLQKNDIADLYTNYYPRKDINPQKIRANFQPEFGFIAGVKRWFSGNHRIHYDLPQAKNNEKILEIGCGDGRSLLQLRAMGYDAYGVETDENIKKVRDELSLPIYIGTVEDADFEQGQFDYIIANQLLEHIIDLDSFLKKCKELLKDDGVIIFSTPNANSVYRRISGKKWINWHIPYHQQVFTKKSLRTLLAKRNLFLKNTRTVTPTPWTLHQINAFRTEQAFGIKNLYWNKKESTGTGTVPKTSFSKGIILVPKRVLFNIIVFGISVCNKIVDLLGQGDCLIITIKK